MKDCDLADPPAAKVMAAGLRSACILCGGRWPAATGICGYCVGRAKAQAERVNGPGAENAAAIHGRIGRRGVQSGRSGRGGGD